MKRITLLVLMLSSVLAFGQKAVKPNISKALKSFQEGKLAEAKENIDLATTYEKTKDDGKTWYYRGLIYAALDTTSNPEFKSLSEGAFAIALESFAKADQLGKAGSEYFTTAPNTVVPVTKAQQLEGWANYYLNKSINALQDTDDFEGGIAHGQKTAEIFEKTLKTYPNDTLAYYVTGLAAQNAEKYDLAIESLNKYFTRGGKSKDAYIILYQIYSGPKEDKPKALEIVRQGRAKIPNNPDFPKLEIGLLIDLDKVDEAKGNLETAVAKEPQNKLFHFYLGYVNSKLEKWDDAKANYEAALKIDPSYFEAQSYLAQIYYIDAANVKKQMDMLGISAADKKKKIELDKVMVEKYRIALPPMEKAEKLNPSDTDVLERLRAIYYYLGEDAKEQRVAKRLKELGVD
jgi:tetratricopeptide (TPR) repeat protein